MGAAISSRNLVNIYQNTRYHVTDVSVLHSPRRQNFKPRITETAL
jgi:hypothetical protein